VKILEAIGKVGRFDMLVMFLSKAEKQSNFGCVEIQIY